MAERAAAISRFATAIGSLTGEAGRMVRLGEGPRDRPSPRAVRSGDLPPAACEEPAQAGTAAAAPPAGELFGEGAPSAQEPAGDGGSAAVGASPVSFLGIVETSCEVCALNEKR